MLNTVISKLDIEKLDKINEEEKKKVLVICPYCGAQFMPCEVYMPEAFIGHATDIVRDSFGMLVYADYKKAENMPSRSECFTCEYCDQPFEVEATPMIFKTKKAPPETNFKQQYVSLI